jgi:hypothetical protein
MVLFSSLLLVILHMPFADDNLVVGFLVRTFSSCHCNNSVHNTEGPQRSVFKIFDMEPESK